jgi:methanogenic corrinoid protein MtbC1
MNLYVSGYISRPLFNFNKFASMAMSMVPKGGNPTDANSYKIYKDSAADCNTSLLSIIESNIIPRLLSSQTLIPEEIRSTDNKRELPTELEVQEFALICTSDDDFAPTEFIARLLNQGLSKENIFLDLITPAARYLGAQWELNQLDFYLVTHGLVRLHSVTHNIGYSYLDGPLVSGEVRRVMIASAPGSEHLLGPLIVSEFFRKEGWQVVLEISPSVNELVHAVSNEWFDAIGLSVSIQPQLNGLSELISQIKNRSRNPRIAVLLGGPIFTIQNFEAADFGAGAICTNAQDAVKLTQSLIVND